MLDKQFISIEEQERLQKLARGSYFYHFQIGDLPAEDLLVVIGYLGAAIKETEARQRHEREFLLSLH